MDNNFKKEEYPSVRGLNTVIADIQRITIELLDVTRQSNMTIGGQLTSGKQTESMSKGIEEPPTNIIQNLEEILVRLVRTADFAFDNRNILQN